MHNSIFLEGIREHFHLEAGDRLEFVIDAGDVMRVIPIVSSITALKGMLSKPKRAVTLKQMQKAIMKGVQRK